MINHFSDLVIWQKSRNLYVRLYRLLENSRDYFFRDQILRAALSISNNIAEGFGRRSKREFLYFLNISKGSSNEVESMLYILSDLSKIPEASLQEMRDEVVDIYNKTSALITKVNRQLDAETPHNKK